MSESLTSAQASEGTTQADSAENGVIRLGGPKKEREPVEMVPLFAINGTTYKVPKKVRPNVGLQIIAKFEQEGEAVGVMFMLRKLMGVDALNALLAYEDLDPADMDAVTTKLMEMTYSGLENNSGN